MIVQSNIAASWALRASRVVIFVAGVLFAMPVKGAVSLDPLVTAQTPVYVANAGDTRLFIVELAGRIRVFDPTAGALLPTPFLDITAKVSTGGERGLFSVAFHPDYQSTGFFYVDYTNLSGDTVIERYHLSADPNVADPSSAAQLLLIPQPFPNHNGGQLQIGRNDGDLHIGMGDGGSDGDPSCYSQRPDSLLGKMLRLDVRKNANQPPYYAIPADNPFAAANDPTGQIPDEIWAFGLRNPWRFSFDRATGDLYIGDVGEDRNEEVDLHRATSPGGQNFGWKVMEGLDCFDSSGCPAGTPACNAPALTLPIHQYTHATGDCAITGGYVYRGQRAPEILGQYLFADYCSGVIQTLREASPGTWVSDTLAGAPGNITSFGEDVDGELYVTFGDQVSKLVSDSPPAVVPSSTPSASAALAAFLVLAGTTALTASRRRRPSSSQRPARARWET